MEHKKSTTEGSDTCRTQPYKTALMNLSRAAKQRLKWMDHFDKYRNARLTCRHFGISPDTFYLWRKRYSPDDLNTLEDDFATRKPHKTRTSAHAKAQLTTIQRLKNTLPRLGKIRIARLLKETGYGISSSTIGRLLRKEKNDE